jgi:hypothetical protein
MNAVSLGRQYEERNDPATNKYGLVYQGRSDDIPVQVLDVTLFNIDVLAGQRKYLPSSQQASASRSFDTAMNELRTIYSIWTEAHSYRVAVGTTSKNRMLLRHEVINAKGAVRLGRVYLGFDVP